MENNESIPSNDKEGGKKSKDKKTEKDVIPYPLYLCRFDEEYLKFDHESILDAKTLAFIRERVVNAKMLWESKIPFPVFKKESVFLEEYKNILKEGHEPIEVYDFLPCLYMSMELAKMLSVRGRLHADRHLFQDRNVVVNYFNESVKNIISIYEKYPDAWNVNCFHPYLKLILNRDKNHILTAVKCDDHKKLKNNFIGVSNSEKKQLKDVFTKLITRNRNIFLFRLDVCLKYENKNDGVSLNDYRKGVDLIIHRIKSNFSKQLLCTVDLIFPTALSFEKVKPTSGLAGHILLIFHSNALALESIIFEMARRSSSTTILNINHFNSYSLRVTNCASGVMRSTSQSCASALDQLSDFLTIERRLVRPGDFCKNNKSSKNEFSIRESNEILHMQPINENIRPHNLRINLIK